MNLTTKETDLLKDLKGQEELCIEKYGKYANEAHCDELKCIFNEIADVEREHLKTVNELMGGSVKPVGGSGSTRKSSCGTGNCRATYSDPEWKKKDAFLCSDMLSTEKHVSSLYNTSIFEFSDPQARNVLNHMQTEEQDHGLAIYDFMNANNMYQ